MSATPLSDAITEHAETNTPDSYDRFLALFRASTIGIVAVGTPMQDSQSQIRADGSLGAGRTTYGDGRPRILAYADPEAALRNFGPRFNAGLSGEVLLQMAAVDSESEGILINSATREISLIIEKSTAWSLLHATEGTGRRAR